MSMTIAEQEFPTLEAVDTVVREAQALVQRYRLLRRLKGPEGLRMDLRGAPPEPALVDEMVRQLVPGVDAPLGSTAIDWPIPAGVRLETLFASPWLNGVAEERGLYSLPGTAADFADQFQAKTGIAPDSHAMDRNYRVTPIELGRVAEEVRGSGEGPNLAYLLLVSRHFDEAVEAAPVLGDRRRGIRFRRPLIDGFKLLAELEREALIVEDLGHLNLLSVRRIRQLLDGNGRLLRKEMAKYPQLKRLFDYQMIGSDVLGGFDNFDAAGQQPTSPALRASAAARGQLDADIVTALAGPDDLPRTLLRAAFPDPVAGTRASPLSNDEPATFYGFNWTVAGAMQADLGADFQHGDENNATGADRERQAMLAAEIIAHADPQLDRRNVDKTANLRGKETNGTNRQRDAQAYGQLMLPGRRKVGSAPRPDVALWSDRWVDAPLWRALLHRRLGNLELGIDDAERADVEAALRRLGELFERTFSGGCRNDDVAGREDAVKAACDLATGVSAISTNRYFSRAILTWLQIYSRAPGDRDQRDHGSRWLASIAHVLRVRRRRGTPPVGDGSKGKPRRRRSATMKRNALRDLDTGGKD